jgi:hypothetical protein
LLDVIEENILILAVFPKMERSTSIRKF